MSAQRSNESQRERAFEHLAHESQVSVEEVARLYENERAKLAVGARLTGFLAIFSLRNVRTRLRGRANGEQVP